MTGAASLRRAGCWGGLSLALHAALLSISLPADTGPASTSSPLRIVLAAPAADAISASTTSPSARKQPTEPPTPPERSAESEAAPAAEAATLPDREPALGVRGSKIRSPAQPPDRPRVAPSPVARHTAVVTAPEHKPVREVRTSQNAPPVPHTLTKTVEAESADQAAAVPGMSSEPAIESEHLAELEHLLHSAIDRRKHYPLSALRRGREGTARVAFRLFPDGRLEGVALATPSGVGALDRAALEAVRGIAPFTPARDFLKRGRDLEVAIVFRRY